MILEKHEFSYNDDMKSRILGHTILSLLFTLLLPEGKIVRRTTTATATITIGVSASPSSKECNAGY